jgi:prepilin-type N-terminal cleavage/methylation domain-containing protein/prepilin-type processing-associated H-X9-DG protein
MKKTVNNRSFRKNHAFTLVELLVCITIIVLLMTIILSVIGWAKMKAARIVSCNNLRQLVTAYIAYEHDHGYTMPYDPKSGNTDWVRYMVEVEGYPQGVLMSPICNPRERPGLGDRKTAWRLGAKQGGFSNGRPMESAMKYLIGSCQAGERRVKLKIGPKPVKILAMAENVCMPYHQLAVYVPGNKKVMYTGQIKPSQALGNIPGVQVKSWELFEWRGPVSSHLARQLGKPESMGVTEFSKLQFKAHQTSAGLSRARPLGAKSLVNGVAFPNSANGVTDLNYIYMMTELRSEKEQTIEIAIFGDDLFSLFVTQPKEEKKTYRRGGRTSCYGINVWAQSHHPYMEEGAQAGNFFTRTSLGDVRTPVFCESTWADLQPLLHDPVPGVDHNSYSQASFVTNQRGGLGGMARAYLNRYGNFANNVAFMDGHVEDVPLDELWKLRWNRRWRATKK